jgi:hypothetical protein
VDALVWALTELMVDGSPGYGLIEWTRMEAAKVSAPRPDPTDASQHTVTMRAPEGISTIYLMMSGRAVSIPQNGLIRMCPQDAKPVLGIGWTPNNLEETPSFET